jgi:DeoR family fructose operon transcriptional repressor
LCEADLEQVALKSLMMQQAGDLIVLADAGKLGRADQIAWAPLPPRWTLVTDEGASDAQRKPLSDAGARVIVAAAH